MHAIVMEKYGGPDVLHIADVGPREPRPGWVAVDLKAAGLNWHDTLVRQGIYHSALPHTPGADGAGIRRDTGEDVVILPSLNWGDREAAPAPEWEILGDSRPGTYAETVVVPECCLAPLPTGMSWSQAACLALTGGTAHRALFARGRLSRGESVLILGAGGGLSTTAVTLAAPLAGRVIVTSSSQAKIDGAMDRGASGGVLYTDADWPLHARNLSPGGEGYDLIIDSVGNWAESLLALRPGGRLVVLGSMGGDSAQVDVRRFYFDQSTILGTTMASPNDYAQFLALIDTLPSFDVAIDQTWPLEQAAEAHRAMEAGQHFGHLALDIS